MIGSAIPVHYRTKCSFEQPVLRSAQNAILISIQGGSRIVWHPNDLESFQHRRRAVFQGLSFLSKPSLEVASTKEEVWVNAIHSKIKIALFIGGLAARPGF